MAYDEKLAEPIRKPLGKRAGLTEKKMFGGIGFMLNGNMCCGVHGQEMIVRIDPEKTDQTLGERHTRAFDLTGRAMKGWILVAPDGLSNDAALAAAGHSNLGMAAAVGFENFASGIGGVTVVAYLSALCNLRFTATQYALLSALASIAGRFITGTTVGALIDAIGYVSFYVLTTIVALPGVVLFWFMIRSGLADLSIGSAGKESS